MTVITRRTGAVALARLGHRVARAVEQKLVVVCVESGEATAEPRVILPGEVPEGVDETVAEICAELARAPHLDELRGRCGEEGSERPLADPEVEVRWLRTPDRLGAVLGQLREGGATYLIAFHNAQLSHHG